MTNWKALCGGSLLAMLAACSVLSHRPAPSVVVIAPPADLPASAPAVASMAAAEPAPDRAAPEQPKPPVPADMRAEPPPPASDNPPQPAAPEATAVTPAARPVTTAAAQPAQPPAETAAPPRQVLYFKPDAYKLAAADMPRLEAHARRLKASPALHLLVQAYADGRGAKDYNLALSKKRAQTVARQLVAMGAPPQQIEIVYHGEPRARQEGRSERAAAADRRVELSYR